MKISDFSFEVPPSLIAVQPLSPRSSARMMVYDRGTTALQHSSFRDLPGFLRPGDMLVFNNSFVLPARFFGRRSSGGKIEGLLLSKSSQNAHVWIKGKATLGDRLQIDGVGDVEVVEKVGKEVRLSCSSEELATKLRASGVVPVPPYIVAERLRRQLKAQLESDLKDYQSIFAHETKEYSVAAPTASLHFDQELMDGLKDRGVEVAEVTLHVGEGTFAPVEASSLDGHRMHSEEVRIPSSTWDRLMAAKREGGRIIAVGTTVCRSLESAARLGTDRQRESFSTELFIRPPFEFRMVDGLITNFHWPDSTLIVLVATFLEAEGNKAGPNVKHLWRDLYSEAIRQKYRLFSYGDGILIL